MIDKNPQIDSRDRFFAAEVDLLNAYHVIDQARDHLKHNAPYMAIIEIRIAFERLANAMEQIYKESR